MQAKQIVFVHGYLQKGCDCVHYILICHWSLFFSLSLSLSLSLSEELDFCGKESKSLQVLMGERNIIVCIMVMCFCF